MKILKINEFLNNNDTDIQSTAFYITKDDGKDLYVLDNEKQFVKEYNKAIANNTAEEYYNKYVVGCYNECGFLIDESAFDFENPIRIMKVPCPQNDHGLCSKTVSSDYWDYETIKRELWMTNKDYRWTSKYISECGGDAEKCQIAINNKEDEENIKIYKKNYKQDLLDFEITDDENPKKVIFKFTDAEITKLVNGLGNHIEPFKIVANRIPPYLNYRA